MTAEHAEAGTELEVTVLGEPRTAWVVSEPKYDAGSEPPRA